MRLIELLFELPLDTRVEVREALTTIIKSGLFESIDRELTKEICAAAMVLAHTPDYGNDMNRVAVKAASITLLMAGFREAAIETKEN